MEILRRNPPTAELELAGSAQIPEATQLPPIPLPEYDPQTTTIELGALHAHLGTIKSTSERSKKDHAAMYYYDHEDRNGLLSVSSNSPFSENGNGTIPLDFDKPEINPQNPEKYLPKTKSVGLLAHYTRDHGLPNYEILRYLFLHRAYHQATSLIVVETPKDRYGFTRTSKSPNALSSRAFRIPQNMSQREKELRYHNGSLRPNIIRATIYNVAAEEGYFAMFRGSPNETNLKLKSPRELVT